jgi:hypothetical protein
MPHGRRFTRHISVDDVKALEMWNNHRVTSETEISRWRDLGAWCRAYGEGGLHVGMTMASLMPEGGGGRIRRGPIPIDRGMTDLIPAWSLMLAPDSKEIKIETDASKIKADWAEAVPLKEYADSFHGAAVQWPRFFLMPPNMSENPSAFFAVQPPETHKDQPNMVFVELKVQSASGVTIHTDKSNKEMVENMSTLAAVVENSDTMMGFTIKVLVNCVALHKGDLLTKAAVEKTKRPLEAAKPVTTKTVFKRMRQR